MAPPLSVHEGPGDIPIELPEITTASVIGISVAIAGNVLISLALNVQKLAHRRVEREKLARAKERIANERAAENGNRAGNEVSGEAARERDGELDAERSATNLAVVVSEPEHTTASPDAHPRRHGLRMQLLETEPLIPSADPTHEDVRRNYGLRANGSSSHVQQTPSRSRKPKRSFFTRLGLRRSSSGRKHDARGIDAEQALLPVDVISEETAVNGLKNGRNNKMENIELSEEEDGSEADYLKSKMWWFGFLLMNVGELGNFISYAFAPASVVAPLGTFALMANCVFAPLMLNERFRKRDLLGIFIAIIGAVTVVLASNTTDVRLDPAGLVRAISQRAFIAYACVYIIGACILALLSRGEAGRRWVFVDVGLCALFGGFTVLSTKGVSTLISLEWIDIFTEWITYPVIIVLIGTGVGQIRYLNRALMRFDSKVVIPIQFVLFNLSAIVGSAILYGDFKKATFHQFVTFLYGCAATFAGVFIIAWAPSSSPPPSPLPSADGRLAPVEEEGGGGTVGRRNRATLVLPGEGQPILRKKHSAVNVMGLSPAQHLLLVHTPPREGMAAWPGLYPSSPSSSEGGRREGTTPELSTRRRAISGCRDR